MRFKGFYLPALCQSKLSRVCSKIKCVSRPNGLGTLSEQSQLVMEGRRDRISDYATPAEKSAAPPAEKSAIHPAHRGQPNGAADSLVISVSSSRRSSRVAVNRTSGRSHQGRP